jgi:hypothetical protein
MIKKFGQAPMLEQSDAQTAFNAGLYAPRKLPYYLNCVNKHPCSTQAIMFNSGTPEFEERLRESVVNTIQQLKDLTLDADTHWIAPYLRQLIDTPLDLGRNAAPALLV